MTGKLLGSLMYGQILEQPLAKKYGKVNIAL